MITQVISTKVRLGSSNCHFSIGVLPERSFVEDVEEELLRDPYVVPQQIVVT
jgi:hypothetical protein